MSTNGAVTPTVIGVNTCKLCRKTFTAPSAFHINPANPTATTPAAQASFALMEHVMKDHQKIDLQLQTQAAQFLGMLRMMVFQIRDQGVERQRDFIRWYVHQSTLNAQITDKKLRFHSEQLAISISDLAEANHFLGDVPDHAEKTRAALRATIADIIAATLTELRAELQEPEKYPNGPEAMFKTLMNAAIGS